MLGRVKVNSIRRHREKGMAVKETTVKGSWKAKRLRGMVGMMEHNGAALSIAVRDGNVDRATGVSTGSIW